MNKTNLKIDKPIYVGLSIRELSKTVMYEFWYDNIKLKYQEKRNLCYMDTNSFFVNIKTEGVYKDIVNDFEKWFWHIKLWNWKTLRNR